MVVGLTGGIASGKSAVLSWLRDQGCPVQDADLIAREVVEPGEPALTEIVHVFGSEILHPDGTLNRRKLGEMVFGDTTSLEKLNAIVHPAVVERLQEAASVYRGQKQGNIGGTTQPLAVPPLQGTGIITYHLPLVLDIPLLYEAGLTHLVDQVWVVWVNATVQLERLIKRDGDQGVARIWAQMPLDEKRRLADRVIDNSGTWDETVLQLQCLLRDAHELEA